MTLYLLFIYRIYTDDERDASDSKRNEHKKPRSESRDDLRLRESESDQNHGSDSATLDRDDKNRRNYHSSSPSKNRPPSTPERMKSNSTILERLGKRDDDDSPLKGSSDSLSKFNLSSSSLVSDSIEYSNDKKRDTTSYKDERKDGYYARDDKKDGYYSRDDKKDGQHSRDNHYSRDDKRSVSKDERSRDRDRDSRDREGRGDRDKD